MKKFVCVLLICLVFVSCFRAEPITKISEYVYIGRVKSVGNEKTRWGTITVIELDNGAAISGELSEMVGIGYYVYKRNGGWSFFAERKDY